MVISVDIHSFIFIPSVLQSTFAYEHGICQNTEFMLEQFIFAPQDLHAFTGVTANPSEYKQTPQYRLLKLI
jgi:hypothetical protein